MLLYPGKIKNQKSINRGEEKNEQTNRKKKKQETMWINKTNDIGKKGVKKEDPQRSGKQSKTHTHEKKKKKKKHTRG